MKFGWSLVTNHNVSYCAFNADCYMKFTAVVFQLHP